MKYYYPGMSREEFDEILTTAFEMGDFVAESEEEMAALNESQLRITAEREEPGTHQGKCQYDTYAVV